MIFGEAMVESRAVTNGKGNIRLCTQDWKSHAGKKLHVQKIKILTGLFVMIHSYKQRQVEINTDLNKVKFRKAIFFQKLFNILGLIKEDQTLSNVKTNEGVMLVVSNLKDVVHLIKNVVDDALIRRCY